MSFTVARCATRWICDFRFFFGGLSELRSQFIMNRGWGEAKIIKQGFIDRDNKLKSYQGYDKIILWLSMIFMISYKYIQILELLAKL